MKNKKYYAIMTSIVILSAMAVFFNASKNPQPYSGGGKYGKGLPTKYTGGKQEFPGGYSGSGKEEGPQAPTVEESPIYLSSEGRVMVPASLVFEIARGKSPKSDKALIHMMKIYVRACVLGRGAARLERFCDRVHDARENDAPFARHLDAIFDPIAAADLIEHFQGEKAQAGAECKKLIRFVKLASSQVIRMIPKGHEVYDELDGFTDLVIHTKEECGSSKGSGSIKGGSSGTGGSKGGSSPKVKPGFEKGYGGVDPGKRIK